VSLIEANLDPKSTENGDQALIAIIEEGVDILHGAFRDASGKTRIISIWDQTDAPRLEGEGLDQENIRILDIPSTLFSFGREYNENQINEYIINSGDIPITLRRNISGIKHAIEVTQVISNIASESKFIIVISAIEGHPHFLIAYELALKHIKYISSQKEKKPVVINISQGLHYGGHDGKSQIEKTLDHFSNYAKDPGVVIVTAAGNSRNKKIHAKLVAPIQSPSFLYWNAMNCYRDKHKIELWFNPKNLMKFRLINSSNDRSRWFFQNDSEGYEFPTGDRCRLLYKVGDGSLAITVFAASTSQIIEIGEWKLEIVGMSLENSADDVHAWIQHINGRISTRAIEFTNPDQIDEKITLTTFGTAKTVITVGSVNPRDSLSASEFSSCGPTRDDREQPILVASGDRGTSFAAPQVTGVIALLLSARKKQCDLNPALSQFNAADIKEILINSYTEGWRYDIGHGVLDIKRLLDNLDELVRK
jgi:subtilisin family serine protease